MQVDAKSRLLHAILDGRVVLFDKFNITAAIDGMDDVEIECALDDPIFGLCEHCPLGYSGMFDALRDEFRYYLWSAFGEEADEIAGEEATDLLDSILAGARRVPPGGNVYDLVFEAAMERIRDKTGTGWVK